MIFHSYVTRRAGRGLPGVLGAGSATHGELNASLRRLVGAV